MTGILDEYAVGVPSHQTAIDLFKGEWASRLPGSFSSGPMDFFHDLRIEMISQEIGGFDDKTILELGPLEGAHTSMMNNEGAKSILAVEANSRAFMKCLITKNMLHLDRAEFLLGNFDELPGEAHFDFALACGVIYHCQNPVRTLVHLTRRTNVIGLWSHYFAANEVRSVYGNKFDYVGRALEYEGYSAQCYTHHYGEALDRKGFCGGCYPHAHWMDLMSWESLLGALGFEFKILAHSTTHQYGPEFTAVATRR